MNGNEHDQEDFVMLHRQGREACVALLQERKLQPRDLAVLWAMTLHLNWRSGRMRVTASHLAKETRMDVSVVTNSLKRLRENLVISKVYEKTTGESYYLFNPWYISAGASKSKRRGHAIRQFKDSLE